MAASTVTINVMLAIHAKKTTSADMVKPLRHYIVHHYSEREAHDMEEDLLADQQMHNDVERAMDALEVRRDLLQRYNFCALSVIESSFKQGRKATQQNIHFEKAAIAFNLGAVQSQLALSADRSSPNGLKQACNYFQASAGAFPFLRDNSGSLSISARQQGERLKRAKNLKLLLTAGVGSDHIDLNTAAEKGLTVAEVSGSNVVSVAEDELMRILILLRNFVPAHKQVAEGGWNVAAVAYKVFNLEGKTVGTVGSGRIGVELLKRLKAFDCKLLYYARHQNKEVEKLSGATWESDLDKFVTAYIVPTVQD